MGRSHFEVVSNIAVGDVLKCDLHFTSFAFAFGFMRDHMDGKSCEGTSFDHIVEATFWRECRQVG